MTTPRSRARGSFLAIATAIVVLIWIAGTGVAAGSTAQNELGGHGVFYAPSDDLSEEAYVERVPEPGDRWFEAEASDGSWISYVNPRDKYRSPYLGGGSGKICVTLLNEHGEAIVGKSVPNTSVTIETGEALSWHEHADPITVRFPMTAHYGRPLDADQFGTDSDLPQGDGYLDSHCVDFHGLPEDAHVTYGEATMHGEHAEAVDVVGYIQLANEAWDSDVDPIEDATSYESAGGEMTFHRGGSHGQVVVVLQLNPDALSDDVEDDPDGGNDTDDGSPEDPNESRNQLPNQANWTMGFDGSETLSNDSAPQINDSAGKSDDGNPVSDREVSPQNETLPGFTALVALIALSLVAVARTRARR